MAARNNVRFRNLWYEKSESFDDESEAKETAKWWRENRSANAFIKHTSEGYTVYVRLYDYF